jgi:hypothetical protein
MGRGADNGVDLCRDAGRFFGLDMISAAERWSVGPKVAPVALEFDVGIALAEVLGYALYGDIRSACHVVVQADGLALQAGQARGWRGLKINSVCGGRHDL